jgi:biopolymer transport protein ExbB/TolQ
MVIFAANGDDLQQAIFNAAELLFYPVLIAAVVCLIWVLIELGWLVYELYLRFRYRDLEALEIRTLRARQAFADGRPRRAYRYLQENNYSMVVARFLFDLIRNYQTQRLAVKPLKLLQEYEFYTVKRLERTRVLVRLGPMLGLMGTLIPLSPALVALANGDTQELADQLRIAFSVTVIGLLIGGLAFTVSIIRDRIYSQDISDLEYLLELLEGGPKRLRAGRRKDADGRWVDELEPAQAERPEDEAPATAEAEQAPLAAQLPVTAGMPVTAEPAVTADQRPDTGDTVGFATPFAPVGSAEDELARPVRDALAPTGESRMDWSADADPFASLGPVEDPEDRV